MTKIIYRIASNMCPALFVSWPEIFMKNTENYTLVGSGSQIQYINNVHIEVTKISAITLQLLTNV